MLGFTTTVVSNAADDDSVATSQTPAGAGNFTLTSATVTFGSGSAQKITITSLSNISNRTFTITGTDIYGNVQTSTLTGPNATTVTSTLAYLSVTNVAISGAAGGALSVGNSAYSEGRMYVVDANTNPTSIVFGCKITNSPTYTVQHTYDDVTGQASSSPLGISGPGATTYNPQSTSNTWFNHPIVAAVTANADGNYAFPVRGIRLTLSAAGTVAMRLQQAGAY